MTTPFIGEIRIMAFGHAPFGWAPCDGALVPIQQNQALFSLLGTTYGGNGVTTFALPDLRGRAGVHPGQPMVQGSGGTVLPLPGGTAVVMGEAGGQEAVALTLANIPEHTHYVRSSSADADTGNPANALVAGKGRKGVSMFTLREPDTNLHPASVSNAPGGAPHPNMQPFLALQFCIALAGDFPTRP